METNKIGGIMLSKIEAFLDGKKTYIMAILTGILGIYSTYHPIPQWVWAVDVAAFGGALRSAIGTTPPKV